MIELYQSLNLDGVRDIVKFNNTSFAIDRETNKLLYLSYGQWLPVDLDNEISFIAANYNYLYIVGDFHSIGDVQASYIARWNGDEWFAVGEGLTSLPSLFASIGGSLYMVTDRMLIWNGNNWYDNNNGIIGNIIDISSNSNGIPYIVYDNTDEKLAYWTGLYWNNIDFNFNVKVKHFLIINDIILVNAIDGGVYYYHDSQWHDTGINDYIIAYYEDIIYVSINEGETIVSIQLPNIFASLEMTTLSISDLYGDGDRRPNALVRRADVDDSLTSQSALKVLSARQGKFLQDNIIGVETSLGSQIDETTGLEGLIGTGIIASAIDDYKADPTTPISELLIGNDVNNKVITLKKNMIFYSYGGPYDVEDALDTQLNFRRIANGDLLISREVTAGTRMWGANGDIDFQIISGIEEPLRFINAYEGQVLMQTGGDNTTSDKRWERSYINPINAKVNGETFADLVNTETTITTIEAIQLRAGLIIAVTEDATSAITKEISSKDMLLKAGDLLVFREIVEDASNLFKGDEIDYDFDVIRTSDFLRDYEGQEGYLNYDGENGWTLGDIGSFLTNFLTTAQYANDMIFMSDISDPAKDIEGVANEDNTETIPIDEKTVLRLAIHENSQDRYTINNPNTVNDGANIYPEDVLLFYSVPREDGKDYLFGNGVDTAYDFVIIGGTRHGISRDTLAEGNIFVGDNDDVPKAITYTLGNLTDLNIPAYDAGVLNDGDILTFDIASSNWVTSRPDTQPDQSLDTTDDVTFNSVTANDVITGSMSGTEISTTVWPFVSSIDQNLATTSAVTFESVDGVVISDLDTQVQAIPISEIGVWEGETIPVPKGGTGQTGATDGVLNFSTGVTETIETGVQDNQIGRFGTTNTSEKDNSHFCFSDLTNNNLTHSFTDEVTYQLAPTTELTVASETSISHDRLIPTLQRVADETVKGLFLPIPSVAQNGEPEVLEAATAEDGFVSGNFTDDVAKTCYYTYSAPGKDISIQGRITGEFETTVDEVQIYAPGYVGNLGFDTTASAVDNSKIELRAGDRFSVTVWDFFSDNNSGTDPSYDKTTYLPESAEEEKVIVYFGPNQPFDRYESTEVKLSIPWPGYVYEFLWDGSRWFMMG